MGSFTLRVVYLRDVLCENTPKDDFTVRGGFTLSGGFANFPRVDITLRGCL